MYIYIYIYRKLRHFRESPVCPDPVWNLCSLGIVAIFCPFSQFCEITISLLSLQTQPNTAPDLFQSGVEYGKYARAVCLPSSCSSPSPALCLRLWDAYIL